MKIAIIILSIIAIAFVAVQLFGLNSQRNIETYPYQVLQKMDGFEIRQYEASLFTSVKLTNSEYKKASSKGFSILGGYIFGDNQENEKIAMTSPVAMSLEDSMTMMFLVPKKYNKANLPTPTQSAINFQEVPAKKVAAISFGGWANDEKIAQYKQKLTSDLEKQGIDHTQNFSFLGYNAPYEVFGRKNEVIVELGETNNIISDK
jgi:hypothetical protein